MWRQKLVMLLHDPPGKPFFLRAGAGGHEAVTKAIFQRITGLPLRFIARGPDTAAAGADRPIVSPPARTAWMRPIRVDWVSQPIVTHPLSAGVGGGVDLDGTRQPQARAEIRAL